MTKTKKHRKIVPSVKPSVVKFKVKRNYKPRYVHEGKEDSCHIQTVIAHTRCKPGPSSKPKPPSTPPRHEPEEEWRAPNYPHSPRSPASPLPPGESILSTLFKEPRKIVNPREVGAPSTTQVDMGKGKRTRHLPRRLSASGKERQINPVEEEKKYHLYLRQDRGVDLKNPWRADDAMGGMKGREGKAIFATGPRKHHGKYNVFKTKEDVDLAKQLGKEGLPHNVHQWAVSSEKDAPFPYDLKEMSSYFNKEKNDITFRDVIEYEKERFGKVKSHFEQKRKERRKTKKQ